MDLFNQELDALLRHHPTEYCAEGVDIVTTKTPAEVINKMFRESNIGMWLWGIGVIPYSFYAKWRDLLLANGVDVAHNESREGAIMLFDIDGKVNHKGRVCAKGNARVEILSECEVLAYGNAEIIAKEECDCIMYDNTRIVAYKGGVAAELLEEAKYEYLCGER